jgi:dTDP-4-amino-4,6-dideoxygalactose transaminase
MLTADPKAEFQAQADELRAAIERVLNAGRYILGPEVEAFETEFARYLGGGSCIGVANGTDALELALLVAGVASGDRVATVANSVSATAAAIQQLGATPVFIEIDPASMLMSPAALEETLHGQPPVKAVLPVHLYGHCADMPALLAIAARHGAIVVEDCAQAHGASLCGRRAGTWGDLAAFSFYPTKNLGALGDGGAVVSRDPSLAGRVRLLRQYGWRMRYVSDIPGRNSRLDELQAALLRVKLPALDSRNALRAAHAARYLERLAGTGITLPIVAPDSAPCWHQFTVRSPRRDALQARLAEAGIQAAPLYPVPLHHQPAYAQPGLSLPETERACAEVLCLPCHAALRPADIDRVCDEILRWSRA